MRTIGELAAVKGFSDNQTINPDATVITALAKMAKYDLGALLVVKNNRAIGLFSEREYSRKIVLYGKSSANTPVSEVMTNKVIYATEEYSLEQCLKLMGERKLRYLPVLEGYHILAFLSLEEIAEALMTRQEFTITELTRYITGSLIDEDFASPVR